MFSYLRSDKLQYAALNEERLSLRSKALRKVTSITQHWKEFTILCLCILVATLTFDRAFSWSAEHDLSKAPSYREYWLPKFSADQTDLKTELASDDKRWRQFQWDSGTYSSKNPDDDGAVNAAWDKIVPAHGIVAVDHQWATTHNLPVSMSLPTDKSKGVYIIDA